MNKPVLRVTVTAKHVKIMTAITNGATTNKDIASEIGEAESNTLTLLAKMKSMGLIADTHVKTSERRGLHAGEGRRHWSVTDIGEAAWSFFLAVKENMEGVENATGDEAAAY